MENLKQKRRCRREDTSEKINFYKLLSLAQKHAIGKLTIFGYKLLFVRQESNRAFLSQDNNKKVIIVEHTGDIIFNSNIVIR